MLPSANIRRAAEDRFEPIFVQPMGPDPLGWFKTPINSTADFRKMKYRAPPGITGEIFKEMGVAARAKEMGLETAAGDTGATTMFIYAFDLRDRIIEIAVLVTDAQLNLVAEGPVLVVKQPAAPDEEAPEEAAE